MMGNRNAIGSLVWILLLLSYVSTEPNWCSKGGNNDRITSTSLGNNGELYVSIGDYVAKYQQYTDYDLHTGAFLKLIDGYPVDKLSYVSENETAVPSNEKSLRNFLDNPKSFPVLGEIVKETDKEVGALEKHFAGKGQYKLSNILRFSFGYITPQSYVALFKFCYVLDRSKSNLPWRRFIILDGKYIHDPNSLKNYRYIFHKHLQFSESCKTYDTSVEFLVHKYNETDFVGISQDANDKSRFFHLILTPKSIKSVSFGPKYSSLDFLGCPPNLCMSPLIDAMLHTQSDEIHLFSGRWVFTNYSHQYSVNFKPKTKSISEYVTAKSNGIALPNYLDAAFYDQLNQKYYFLKENIGFEYDLNSKSLVHFKIQDHFLGLSNLRIDAAVHVLPHGKNGTLFMFAGNKVMLYSKVLKPTVININSISKSLVPYFNGGTYISNSSGTYIILVRQETVFYIPLAIAFNETKDDRGIAVELTFESFLKCPQVFTIFRPQESNYEYALDPVDIAPEKRIPIEHEHTENALKPRRVPVRNWPYLHPERHRGNKGRRIYNDIDDYGTPPPITHRHYFEPVSRYETNEPLPTRRAYREPFPTRPPYREPQYESKEYQAHTFPDEFTPTVSVSSDSQGKANTSNDWPYDDLGNAFGPESGRAHLENPAAESQEKENGFSLFSLGLTFMTAFVGAALAAAVIMTIMTPAKKHKHHHHHHHKRHRQAQAEEAPELQEQPEQVQSKLIDT